MAYGQEQGGFYYQVSDEQMAAFAGMSDLERLQWVEEARLFTIAARTPESAACQERLRSGMTIHAGESAA